jgi:hypothetical protein
MTKRSKGRKNKLEGRTLATPVVGNRVYNMEIRVNIIQVSQDGKSSTLNARVFRTNVSLAAFLRMYVRKKSCQNGIRTKNSYVKMLMKLTPGWQINHSVHLF